jgi:hypothetical protein
VERHPNYTSIFYMEDDTHLSWPTVISWALDTEVLEPLNFTRCIYRTEVDAETGDFYVLDYQYFLKHHERKCAGCDSKYRFLTCTGAAEKTTRARWWEASRQDTMVCRRP